MSLTDGELSVRSQNTQVVIYTAVRFVFSDAASSDAYVRYELCVRASRNKHTTRINNIMVTVLHACRVSLTFPNLKDLQDTCNMSISVIHPSLACSGREIDIDIFDDFSCRPPSY